MSHYSLDYETTSACDISLGSYRYACDPTTRILMFAISKDAGEPALWDFLNSKSTESCRAMDLLREAIASGSCIYAHNAMFEVAISTYRMKSDLGIDPPDLGQWRCTQAMCRRAAAPESLAAASEFFNLGSKKDPVGKALIDLFSIQTRQFTLNPPVGMKDPSTVRPLKNGGFTAGKRPPSRKSDSPVLEDEILWDWTTTVAGNTMSVREAWDAFCGYCKQDIRAEDELHRKISHFELRDNELASWQFDLRMNHRGVPVNVDALHHADALVEATKEKLERRFMQLTGFASGQRDRVLEWLRERGYPEDVLQAGVVDEILSDPPESMTPEAVEALHTRSLLSYAALKKIPVMRDAACPDGRVRGTTMWHAARTGRAAGRIIQPQNFKKSTIDHSGLCYQMICQGDELDWFEDLWESPLEAIASSIRHFIQLPNGQKVLDADFVGVEARITPWLSGDKNKLKLILDGVDLYKRMASLIFKTDYVSITKEQRTIAKPIELGCCFGVGGKSLQAALAKPPYNVERDRKTCDGYVKTYRESHPETIKAWSGIEEAAKQAISNPNQWFKACDGKLSFRMGRAAGIPYLVMRLPSGRGLYYPLPDIKTVFKRYEEEDMLDDPWKREKGGYYIDQISFYGKLRETNAWGRVHTWGSRLFENAVQAIGADLLNHGMVCAEAAGYEIFMCVHDQALAEDNGLPLDGFLKALCTKQEWAETFPLAADGAVHPYYLKD